ncbi:MAG: alanine racemase [Thermodesulfobacteriota bacterium]
MLKRPTRAIIHRDALSHNYRELQRSLSPETGIMAVVKADAYGHGAGRVAAELKALGCEFFAVALAREAIALRESGITSPILVLGGVWRDDLDLIFTLGLTPVIHDMESTLLVQEKAAREKIVKPVHLKIDTGMSRIGIRPGETLSFLEKFKEMENLSLEGLLSHFSEAEVAGSEFSSAQLSAFNKTAALIKEQGFKVKYRHMANSAAILNLRGSHFDFVRPGIMLYGSYPAEVLRQKISLKPVMEFKTRVLQLKHLPAGSPVSYGQTFVTERDSIIATLPVGYGDGLPRKLSGCGDLIIRGKKAPIRGLICMDLTMCDVTEIPGVKKGDEVTIIGRDGDEEITASEIAEKTGTISYEIFCNITKRVPRIYR